MSGLSITLQSGSIVLCEGLGAMLIISAVAAFLRCAGAANESKALYVGAALAILACIEAELIFAAFFNSADDGRLDAIVISAASALMLCMSSRLSLQQDAAATSAVGRRFAKHTVSTTTLVSLALLAFLVVFHGGSEIAHALHAFARSNGGWNASLNVGVIAALGCLAGLYVAARWLAVQLPARSVFIIASALLFIMSLQLIGAAVQKMQEHVLVPYDAASVPHWLVLVGVNPSWEAIGTQVLIAMIAVCGTVALHLRRPVSMMAAE